MHGAAPCKSWGNTTAFAMWLATNGVLLLRAPAGPSHRGQPAGDAFRDVRGAACARASKPCQQGGAFAQAKANAQRAKGSWGRGGVRGPSILPKYSPTSSRWCLAPMNRSPQSHTAHLSCGRNASLTCVCANAAAAQTTLENHILTGQWWYAGLSQRSCAHIETEHCRREEVQNNCC